MAPPRRLPDLTWASNHDPGDATATPELPFCGGALIERVTIGHPRPCRLIGGARGIGSLAGCPRGGPDEPFDIEAGPEPRKDFLRCSRKKSTPAAACSRHGFAGAASGHKIWGTEPLCWQAKFCLDPDIIQLDLTIFCGTLADLDQYAGAPPATRSRRRRRAGRRQPVKIW
jgi:hypothetical protein